MPTAKTSPDKPKYFILDTNVLLHNPNALFVFKEHHVVIPFPVIEELDMMKRRDDDIGRNARQCIRHLDKLRSIGHLTEGVHWGGVFPTAAMLSPTMRRTTNYSRKRPTSPPSGQ